MFVCGLNLSDFVVWTEKGIFVTTIPFDEKFVACEKRLKAFGLDKFCLS
jgi:hypothetical protein